MFQERFRTIVKGLAGAYARRNPLSDFEELEHLGWLAAFKAQRSFPGGDLDRYVTHAINCTLRNQVLFDRCPATTPQNPHRGTAEALWQLQRLSLDAVREAPRPESERVDRLLDDFDWRARVRRRVAEVLAAYVQRNDPALAVVVREQRPAEVAQARGVSVRKVYRSARRVRVKLQRDQKLRSLLAERLAA